jgi:hypothetical protein
VIDEEHLFDGWEEKDAMCRHSLVAMVVQGMVPANSSIPISIVELFKGLAPENRAEVSFPQNPAEVGRGLDWIANFGGPFLPIEPAKLRNFAAPCFSLKGEPALACRSRLLLALSATGNFAEAKEEFEHILFDRLPFTSEEYAQSMAALAGIELSDSQRKGLVLVD